VRKKATKKKSKATPKTAGKSKRKPARAKSVTRRGAAVAKRAPASKQTREVAANKTRSTRPETAPATKRAKTTTKTRSADEGEKRNPPVAPSQPLPPATAHDPVQFKEERPKLPKTFLNARQLREFRDLLLLKRAELLGDVENLTDEALHRGGQQSTDSTPMPIHMADIGSDNWEQEFTLGLIANEQTLVREIDEALQRIRDKTFGICLATHQPIGIARLQAKPWARYCIEYARAREEGRAT
jgi:RNA polymerase-binding protein DksA